jgi:hypothetical protein
MGYYDKADAAFKWLAARNHPDAPRTWAGVNPTGNLIQHISGVIAAKCAKDYGSDCILVIRVVPPSTEAERLEARLGEIVVPPRMPFMGIFLTGHFGVTSSSSGGFRCWRLAGKA